MLKRMVYACLLLWCLPGAAQQQGVAQVKTTPVGPGWANNTVNVTVFRKNSLVTYGDTQFVAYYNAEGFVMLGKRKTGSDHWLLKQTPYRGHVNDAHNVISIMADGEGYLHMAWDHHNNPLHYCRSIAPGSLELTPEMPMTGQQENKVSYPEFYQLKDGGLLFLYRDGGSGQGNLVMNTYHTATRQWTQLQRNLIDGQNERNAYWQACVDAAGGIHISWVWRESPDVASNHDMCYMVSKDGGISWQRSTGEVYTLPVTAATAERACSIPQKSELINQTSMFADAAGHPYIASYWCDSGTAVPQYHLVYHSGKQWKVHNLGFRTTPFSLSGAGTKQIPVSRPQIIAWTKRTALAAALLFRDEERGSKVSAAVCEDLGKGKWYVQDLTDSSTGSWEPTYDTELWKSKKIVNLFVQRAVQVDGEGKADVPPQPVQVVEWKPAGTGSAAPTGR